MRLGIGPVCRESLGIVPQTQGLFAEVDIPDTTAAPIHRKQPTVLITQHEAKNPKPEYMRRVIAAARIQAPEVNIQGCLLLFRSYKGVFYQVGEDNTLTNLYTKSQTAAIAAAQLTTNE